MTLSSIGGLEAYLRKPDPNVGAILIYGNDVGAVRDAAVRAVTSLAGSIDDPFNVVVLDEHAVSSDPGRIIDEVQSMSLMGGRRVVWVRSADQPFLKAADVILSGAVKGNIIVAEAGILTKISALYSRFEESAHALMVPLYEPSNEDMAMAATAELKRLGFQISAEAVDLLAELSGRSRPVLMREIEKLASYAAGAASIAVEDVKAICGNALGIETDDLVDAVFSGDVEDADRFFHEVAESGIDAGRMAASAHAHAARLIDLRMVMARGMRAEQVVKSARPPIFFKRHAKVLSQLRVWDLEALLGASATLHAAVQQTRLNAALSLSLANRALLGVARSARMARTRSR